MSVRAATARSSATSSGSSWVPERTPTIVSASVGCRAAAESADVRALGAAGPVEDGSTVARPMGAAKRTDLELLRMFCIRTPGCRDLRQIVSSAMRIADWLDGAGGAPIESFIGSKIGQHSQIITGTVCTISGSQLRSQTLGSFSVDRRTGGLTAEEVTAGDRTRRQPAMRRGTSRAGRPSSGRAREPRSLCRASRSRSGASSGATPGATPGVGAEWEWRQTVRRSDAPSCVHPATALRMTHRSGGRQRGACENGSP